MYCSAKGVLVARLTAALVSLALLVAWSGGVRAQDGYVREEADRALRLEGWLELHAERGREVRSVTGAASFLSAAAWFALSGILLFGEHAPESSGQRDVRTALSAAMALFGGGFFASGLVKQLTISREEDRLLRWQRARAGSLNEAEISRFEGELRASVLEERARTELGRWVSLGGALVGAGLMAAPLFYDESRGERTMLLATGGVAVGLGLIAFIASFGEVAIEGDWNDYEAGLTPLDEEDGPSLQVTPVVSTEGAGLSVLWTM